MTRRDWIKIVMFVLIPINLWLIVLYRQKMRWWQMWREGAYRDNVVRSLKLEYIRRSRLKIQVGMKMPDNFPFPIKAIGKPIVCGAGKPVLFLNISWVAAPEVWELAINEALSANPNLQLVLLHSGDGKEAFEAANILWHKWNTYRLSILMSVNWFKVFGNIQDGVLAVFCDERGIVRHIEPYPPLKFSPHWQEEVADWRPKLHQAVKKVLDKFFPKAKNQ